MVARLILAIRLIRHDSMICNRVRARTLQLSEIETHKPSLAFEHMFLLVIYIQKIHKPRPISKGACNPRKKPPHHRSPKRIEQKHQAWPLRELELDSVPACHSHLHRRAPCRPPLRGISPREARERRIQLYPLNPLERQFRCQQHSPTHTRPNVDKRKLLNRRTRPTLLPSP